MKQDTKDTIFILTLIILCLIGGFLIGKMKCESDFRRAFETEHKTTYQACLDALSVYETEYNWTCSGGTCFFKESGTGESIAYRFCDKEYYDK